MRWHDRGAQDSCDGGRVSAADFTAHGWRPAVVLRLDSLDDVIAERVDTRALPTFYERDGPAMLESPIAPPAGFIEIGDEPGFGMTIKREAWEHPAAIRHISGKSENPLRSIGRRDS